MMPAHKFNLRAGFVFDLIYGWDLLSDDGFHGCLKYMREVNAMVVILEIPCTLYCWFNYAVNYKDRLDELYALRDKEVRFVLLAALAIRHQIEKQDHAMLESPGHSQLFDRPELVKVKKWAGDWIIDVEGHGCYYGFAIPRRWSHGRRL